MPHPAAAIWVIAGLAKGLHPRAAASQLTPDDRGGPELEWEASKKFAGWPRNIFFWIDVCRQMDCSGNHVEQRARRLLCLTIRRAIRYAPKLAYDDNCKLNLAKD
jgi:hypothetical protein